MELRHDTTPIRMRNYGRIVQDMIAYATTLAPSQERDSLELYIAQCMRQRNLVWNRDQEAGMQRVKEANISSQFTSRKKTVLRSAYPPKWDVRWAVSSA